ncbi:MAG: rhodanese-like domain-containing protein [Planctomycetes bacterium]|nr:rhodanese-like domain-containing protein [Planctomycetota bacterium]
MRITPTPRVATTLTALALAGATWLAAPAAPGRAPLRLPEPVAAGALATALADQPAAYMLLDVRPLWQHREYHVPGAVPADLDGVVEQVRGLPGDTRIVILDRDGTTAWAVAGAVMQALGPGGPTLRVLQGGTAAWFHTVEVPRMGASATGQAAPARTVPEARTRKAGC